MITLPEKLLRTIDTALTEFPKVEAVVIGDTRKDQERNILIAVQRVESFEPLFKISLTIMPLMAGAVFSPLTACVDPSDTPHGEATEVHRVEIDFKTGTGCKELLEAINIRLRREGIADDLEATRAFGNR